MVFSKDTLTKFDSKGVLGLDLVSVTTHYENKGYKKGEICFMIIYINIIV